jgi:SAM-dependent methyltransferase
MKMDQREYWNGPAGERWAQTREQIDANLAALGDAAIAFAAPRPGERVLDIGCGSGTTTFALRRLVEPGGSVCGVDISAPLLAVARERAAGTDVTFIEADAATHRFDRFDLVFSRFGVMFFTDPVAAFANLKTTGGRIAFVCWRALGDNPWATVPLAAAGDLVPAEPPADPHAPGPFAFADRDRVADILARAGWRDIAIEPHDSSVVLGATLDEAIPYVMLIGPLARRTAELDRDTRAKIRDRVTRDLATRVSPSGIVLPAAAWLVSAR